MVIPRSRSSGALSIESNARNCTFGLFFDNTLVIAAVNVVLPWSMCPIVPMFTCGLLRSNFSFAIECSAPPLELDENPPASPVEPAPPDPLPGNSPGRLGDHFLGYRTWRLGVMREMHGERRATLRPAAKIRSV